MTSEQELINYCKKFDARAQKLLYEMYAPKMRGITSRYCKDKSEVSDILQDGFLKIFTKIDQYNGVGSFEGWMKTIIINTALEYYRKQQNNKLVVVEDYSKYENIEAEDDSFLDTVKLDLLLQTIQNLPIEYRSVFNMFYIDDYSHKEIAQLLEIDESLSRKRLQRAKNMLKEKLMTQIKL